MKGIDFFGYILVQDLTSVQNMQKKHGLLEADVVSRQDRIDGIVNAADNFCQAGHFDKDTIKVKQEQVIHRYKTLAVCEFGFSFQPCNLKKKKL